MSEKLNLLNFDKEGLVSYFHEIGEQPFRAQQIFRWIYQIGEKDFDQMTDISKSLRSQLSATTAIVLPQILREDISNDGTCKWLIGSDIRNAVETVFIPEKNRGTLCISSQIGCALACTFCSTGKQGFNRNLSTAEIIGQLWLANNRLRSVTQNYLHRPIITNVVMMGMGEPLTNYAAVIPALKIMLNDHAYGLSRRRVTVSSSGIVPAIDRLSIDCPVSLAISLHAPNDELRDELVPINKKYPLKDLMQACQRYLKNSPRDFITFEYVMLDNVNDSIAYAKLLLTLVKDIPCKFNLIPFNPFPGSVYAVSSSEKIKNFADILMDANIIVTVRKTRGDDISAACGQLVGRVQNKRTPKNYVISQNE